MFEQSIGYILQIATIAITLSLGLLTAAQTRKLQHGQNIISVTTKYRMDRSEQLRLSSEQLLSNTAPDLLTLEPGKSHDMLLKAEEAACRIGVILHRNFQRDGELITMAENIRNAALSYVKLASGPNDAACRKAHAHLEYLRQIYMVKVDIYTSADWWRIKKETEGINTSSQEWIDYYATIEEQFAQQMEQARITYKKACDE